MRSASSYLIRNIEHPKISELTYVEFLMNTKEENTRLFFDVYIMSMMLSNWALSLDMWDSETSYIAPLYFTHLHDGQKTQTINIMI